MNILVVGLGSMGKRRISLIQELYPDFVVVGVDKRDDRVKNVLEQFQIPCLNSIEMAHEKYSIDTAFVCTAPLAHNAIITECLQNRWNVFTELNLVSDGYGKNIELAKKNRCKLFLSSTFLYREEIMYIKNKVEMYQRWNYIYHVGQYLPDWHPWENYTEFFVGDKRTNGCREIMAIEFPWLIQTFGKITNTHVQADKMTDLNINYRDNYTIQIEHENGNKGIMIIDVVSPVAVRRLEIYREQQYIRWNGTPDSLYEYDAEKDFLKQIQLYVSEEHRPGYRTFIVENAYKNEIIEFMEMILKDKQPQYSFEQDLEVLKLLDRIEDEI